MINIAGYEELNLIGEGATAQVYQAVQISTGQKVAIKVLNKGAMGLEGEKGSARFARELRLCAQLHNQHIVRLMDQGVSTKGSPYAIFEYIPGMPLSRYLAKNGPLTPAKTKDLMLQALVALIYAHERGVIHRDFKPQNLMLVQTGKHLSLKVVDFGIGAWSDPEKSNDIEQLTLTHESLGTPAYCAPEQLRGEVIGGYTDLYSWGLVFLECLLGKPVQSGSSSAEIIYHQLSDEPIELPEFIIQHPIAGLLRKVLIKDPKLRLADASELYNSLVTLSLEDIVFKPASPSPHSIQFGGQKTQVIHDPLFNRQVEKRLLCLLSFKLKLVSIDASQSLPSLKAEQLLADKLLELKELMTSYGGCFTGTIGHGLMAYFGYPFQSDQDIQLSVRTSLALREAIHDWNLNLESMGLKGLIYQSIHSDVATIVNKEPLISELSDITFSMLFIARNDQILLSEASYKLLLPQANLSILDVKRFKRDGREDLLVYQFNEHHLDDESLDVDTDLFGRNEELKRLNVIWKTNTDTLQVALISSDAGLGKTALGKSFAQKIEEKDSEILLCRCLPEFQHTAMFPILQGLKSKLGIINFDHVEAQRLHVKQLLIAAKIEDKDCFEVLCYWLNLTQSNISVQLHYSPERQKGLLFDTLNQLLHAFAFDNGILLFLEDVHWIDPISLEFLKQLKKQTSQTMLLMTCRPSHKTEEQFQWVSNHLHLKPLKESAGLSLVKKLLIDRNIKSPELYQRLVERSGGIPLFIIELVQIAESDRINQELPLSLMSILSSRINKLGEATKVLQWSAVLGNNFEAKTLSVLLGVSLVWLEEQLSILLKAELIKIDHIERNVIYNFVHALYRDAAYQQISESDLKIMHCKVAMHFTNDNETHQNYASVIAYHYAKGQNFSEASIFTIQAIRKDLGMALSTEAQEKIKNVLKWSEILDDKSQKDIQLQALELDVQALTQQLGWAHPKVLSCVQKTQDFMALNTLQTTYKIKAATLWSLGTIYHVSNQRQAVHDIAKQILDMADVQLDEGLSMYGHCLYGVAFWIDGHYAKASKHLNTVINTYNAKEHQILATDFTLDAGVWAKAALSLVNWAQGHKKEAHLLSEQSVLLAQTNQHMPSIGIALMYQSFLYQYEQNHSKVNEVSTQLQALANTFGLDAVLGYAAVSSSWAANNIQLIISTIQHLKKIGCLLGITYLQSQAAEVFIQKGKISEALELINEGLLLAKETGEEYYLVPLYLQKAYCLLHKNSNIERITDCLQRAKSLCDAQSIKLDVYLHLLGEYTDDTRINTIFK